MKPVAETVDARPRTLTGVLRAACGPFIHLYARGFFSSVFLQVFTVMLLIEAVFLAERFPIVFREVFQHHADPFDAVRLFLCNTTQIFDLALAIAILMAVYWTTLRMRESRELLVLFSAGTGPYQLLAVTLAVAIGAMVLSLTISGVIDPATRFAERSILFNAEFRALRSGINTGQFYRFPNRVAFAPARAKTAGHERTSTLFVYEQVKPEEFRVVTADRALLEGPDEFGRLLLKLGGLTSHTFKPVRATGGGVTQDVSQSTLAAGDLTQQMGEDELLSLQPRGSVAEELSLVEQLTGSTDSTVRHKTDMRLLGERFARALLCLLAPLIALSAICFTTRLSNYFVLPLACMALMTLNLASGWLIRAIVPLTPLGAVSVPTALSVLLAAILLSHIFASQGRLAQPQLARP